VGKNDGVSEHGEPDRPDDDASAPEPESDEDTQPLGPQPPPYASYGQPPSYGQQPPYAQQPPAYGQPYPTQPNPTQPTGYGYPPARGTQSRLPGWAWPLIAVLALAVGLVGGVLGGVAVSTSMNSGGSIQVLGGDNGAPAPLNANNGSVAAVAARLLPSTVQVLAHGGADGRAGGGATGSGFVVDKQGHVITNNHVVADATGPGELKVVDNNGKTHSARIIGRSPVYDIAVLDIQDGNNLRPASLGTSKTMRVGETVVAIGSPLGLSSTVTSGIVSALDRPVTTDGDTTGSSFIDAVQTDAAINPGNSGGPLVNMRGQVVGVNSAIATMGGSLTGESGSIGVGFAIPMEQVRITAAQILKTGEAKYPVIGANVNTGVTTKGAQVVQVPAGTPADRAGLQKGDVVVDVNGTPVSDGIGLIVAIRAHRPGETVTLTIRRNGQLRKLHVTLDAKVG
jgi:putative serine protease PepD